MHSIFALAAAAGVVLSMAATSLAQGQDDADMLRRIERLERQQTETERQLRLKDAQIRDLEDTINTCPCDLVLSATPIDLTAVVKVNKPVVRVRYAYRDNSSPTREEVIREKLGDRL